MATLCTVVAVGNNAWLADWCRLLIIRTLAIANEPERRERLLVRSDAVARPPRRPDARGGTLREALCGPCGADRGVASVHAPERRVSNVSLVFYAGHGIERASGA